MPLEPRILKNVSIKKKNRTLSFNSSEADKLKSDLFFFFLLK